MKLICDKCFFKYPPNIERILIKIKYGYAIWYTLFVSKYDIDPVAFAFELGKLFEFVLTHEEGSIIFFENFDYDFVENPYILDSIDERVIFISIYS